MPRAPAPATNRLALVDVSPDDASHDRMCYVRDPFAEVQATSLVNGMSRDPFLGLAVAPRVTRSIIAWHSWTTWSGRRQLLGATEGYRDLGTGPGHEPGADFPDLPWCTPYGSANTKSSSR